MTLPDSLRQAIAARLGDVRAVEPVGGGCIANAGRVTVGMDDVFVKWGRGETGRTLEAEARGLRALRSAGKLLAGKLLAGKLLRVPDVIAEGRIDDDDLAYLVLEFIQEGSSTRHSSSMLGEGMAELHRVEGPFYGFEADNFIGRLPQENAPLDSWPDFFRRRRLEPQVRMARRNGRWKTGWDASIGRLSDMLDTLLPARPPRSILHGDLWSGNAMIDSEGTPVLIDPAVYYGDRETDLAMMALFGGFDRGVWAAYQEQWPLEDGWEARRDLYQLYHLINHLNHFGDSYAAGVGEIVRRY